LKILNDLNRIETLYTQEEEKIDLNFDKIINKKKVQ